MFLWEGRRVTWRHRPKGRTLRDDKSKEGSNAAAQQGNWGWKGSPGRQQREGNAPPRVAGGMALAMPEFQTSGLQNGEKTHFCCSKPPGQGYLNQSALRNRFTSFMFSRHMRSFPIIASTCLLPTLRFFPTLAFQTWIQSFGSWVKCFFLKDALWACSTWTSRIHLSWLCLGGTQGWWGSLRNQLCAASPRPHLWPHPHRTLLNIELGLQHHLLTENFLTVPIHALPDSITSPCFILYIL